jgi:hypothetical protein
MRRECVVLVAPANHLLVGAQLDSRNQNQNPKAPAATAPLTVRSEYWDRRDGDSGGPSSRFTLVGVPRNRHLLALLLSVVSL